MSPDSASHLTLSGISNKHYLNSPNYKEFVMSFRSGPIAGLGIVAAGVAAPLVVYTSNAHHNPYKECPAQQADCVAFIQERQAGNQNVALGMGAILALVGSVITFFSSEATDERR
jgi:hypothetical protein